jgi:uncharacterized protein YbjT (DUF2867 family)
MVSVFLLGATGFLGGTVLTDLEKEGYEITALVRSGKEKLLKDRKATVVTVSISVQTTAWTQVDGRRGLSPISISWKPPQLFMMSSSTPPTRTTSS